MLQSYPTWPKLKEHNDPIGWLARQFLYTKGCCDSFRQYVLLSAVQQHVEALQHLTKLHRKRFGWAAVRDSLTFVT